MREGGDMPTINIIGLGYGAWQQMPIGSLDALQSAEHLYLRTKEHPVVQQLESKGMSFTTFDTLYVQESAFDNVYKRIVDELMTLAREYGEITYAVPGHPMVAEQTVQLLLQQEKQTDIHVHILGGQSFVDPLLARLQIDPNDGLVIVDGSDLQVKQLNPYLHHIVTQVYDASIASEIKLTLMDVYPDDYAVTLVTAVGIEGQERIEHIPLYMLDRVTSQNNLTALYVPPTDCEDVLNRHYQQARDIFRQLRGPNGCPWDREQTHQSLKKYLIEETEEVLEAIDEENIEHIKEELGDVLLQVFLHAQIAEDDGYFSMEDVLAALNEKMIRRHPHVFGDQEANTTKEVLEQWEKLKENEKKT